MRRVSDRGRMQGQKLVHKSHAGVVPESGDAVWDAHWTELKQLSDEQEFGNGVAFGIFKRDVGIVMLLLLSKDDAACTDPVDPEVFGFDFVDFSRPATEVNARVPRGKRRWLSRNRRAGS